MKSLTKAVIINSDAPAAIPIPVMFNPPDYRVQKTNQFAEVGIPGLGSSLLQFVRGNTQTLTMELFFDTTDSGRDVREFTNAVVGLTDVNAQTHAPPRLLFIWGSLIFPCVLESVTQNFNYFNIFGLPLRATLSVSLKSYDLLEDLLAQVPLESADRTKRHVVKAGETLAAIAAREYQDAGQWRAIAEANNIDNPLTIAPGQALIIPTIE